jgi:hypothetical protein
MKQWWQLILIRSQIIMKLFMWSKLWWNIINKNKYEFSSAFIGQRLRNLVQRLFADVIYDAIWLMNIHKQKYPWFLAMRSRGPYWPGPIWASICKWSCSNPITGYFPVVWKYGQFTSGHIGHTKMPLFELSM